MTSSTETKFVRHQWDIPACWLLGNYPKVNFGGKMARRVWLMLTLVIDSL